MKDAISYLKLDLRISKNSMLMIIPTLIFVAYMFVEKKTYIFGMSWLILVIIICTTTPFNKGSYDHLGQMYHVLPVKCSKMVLGRFMYLIMWLLIMLLIESILLIYLSSIGEIHNREIVTMILCEVTAAVFCFLEYLVCYMFMNKNNQVISILLYTMPALIIFFFCSYLLDNSIISDAQINFITNNKNMFMVFGSVVITLIGYTSYLISYKICRNKDI